MSARGAGAVPVDIEFEVAGEEDGLERELDDLAICIYKYIYIERERDR